MNYLGLGDVIMIAAASCASTPRYLFEPAVSVQRILRSTRQRRHLVELSSTLDSSKRSGYWGTDW